MAREKDIRISVIIPTWNRAEMVVAAVESALKQTFEPLEILVCDDGSSDNSEARVRAIGDPRVRWVSGPRGGHPAIPRNRGIAVSQGNWLAFLDSDDVWLPEKLELQVEALRESGCFACCTDAWRLVPGQDALHPYLNGESCTLDFSSLLKDNRVICSSAIVRKDILERAGTFSTLREAEDYAMWLRVSSMTDFAYIGSPLLVYRDDPKNSVRAKDRGRWDQRIDIMRDLAKWCEQAAVNNVGYTLHIARKEHKLARIKKLLSTLTHLKKNMRQ